MNEEKIVDFRIVNKKILAENNDIRIVKVVIMAKQISLHAKAGQFVVLMASSKGERIPLTIVDRDTKEGTITLIFQEIGFTTKLLGSLKENDTLYALVGPLGNPTEIKNFGEVILVGGGVGIAEIYPVARALKEAGNIITTIVGAKTKNLLILEDELKKLSDIFYVATDDGSYGQKGFVTDILQTILLKNSDKNYQLVYAVGPIPMMKKVAEITKNYNIKTVVSLNALMVDATGMCGCCRVIVGGKTQFSCVDGPEFDAHLVSWDILLKRSLMYVEKEKHICKLFLK